jgi:large subunit ribosomal protein L4
VLSADDVLGWKSLRNVPEVHLIASGQLNTYDVLVSDDVVFTRQALDEFVSVAGKGQTALAVDAPAGRHAAPETTGQDSDISLTKKSAVQDEDDTIAAEAVATEEDSA